MEGSKDEDLMALVTKLVMALIGFLERGLYEKKKEGLEV
jgi:hypothetical protein